VDDTGIHGYPSRGGRLVGLTVYQLSQGQDAWHSLMLAGAAVGLRHAIYKGQ
jgi:hypothetical protein